MRWEGYIDYEETRRAIDLLQAPGEVFEVRVIGTASRKDILSGYFQSADILFQKRVRDMYRKQAEMDEKFIIVGCEDEHGNMLPPDAIFCKIKDIYEKHKEN